MIESSLSDTIRYTLSIYFLTIFLFINVLINTLVNINIMVLMGSLIGVIVVMLLWVTYFEDFGKGDFTVSSEPMYYPHLVDFMVNIVINGVYYYIFRRFIYISFKQYLLISLMWVIGYRLYLRSQSKP